MPQRPPSPDADKVSADSPSIGDAVAALIDVCCTDFTTAHQPAAARLSSVESVEWSGRETSVIQLLPAFLLFSPLPHRRLSSFLRWRAMRQSLPCSCLHSGPSSSPLTYIFNMRSGAASGLHFGLCGGGNFQSNNDLFLRSPKK